jgi:hypothetical protein
VVFTRFLEKSQSQTKSLADSNPAADIYFLEKMFFPSSVNQGDFNKPKKR